MRILLGLYIVSHVLFFSSVIKIQNVIMSTPHTEKFYERYIYNI